MLQLKTQKPFTRPIKKKENERKKMAEIKDKISLYSDSDI